MTNNEFEKMLKKLHISKKEFSRLVGISYGGVVNWGRSNQNVPAWVESWLHLYEDSQKYRKIKKALEENNICEC
jgi:hypothetical protein